MAHPCVLPLQSGLVPGLPVAVLPLVSLGQSLSLPPHRELKLGASNVIRQEDDGTTSGRGVRKSWEDNGPIPDFYCLPPLATQGPNKGVHPCVPPLQSGLILGLPVAVQLLVSLGQLLPLSPSSGTEIGSEQPDQAGGRWHNLGGIWKVQLFCEASSPVLTYLCPKQSKATPHVLSTFAHLAHFGADVAN